jgi:curved DNA binding protein
MAAYTAAECAIRMLVPGDKTNTLTDMFTRVADDFKVNSVQGVLSHQLERNTIDGEKVIASKVDVENPESKVDFEFEENEVYAIDIVMSSGEGKPKEFEQRMTVFKRDQESNYQLKLKASRAIFSEIVNKFSTFPFTMRAMDEKKGKFGIKECLNHQLVQGYPVLQEKQGEVVAHVKFTALLMPHGTVKISGLPFNLDNIKSDKKVTNKQTLETLAKAIRKRKKKKRNRKKKKKNASAEEAKA